MIVRYIQARCRYFDACQRVDGYLQRGGERDSAEYRTRVRRRTRARAEMVKRWEELSPLGRLLAEVHP